MSEKKKDPVPPVSPSVAKEGDYVVLQHYIGYGAGNKRRLSRRRVVVSTRQVFEIVGSDQSYRRDGSPRGRSSTRVLEPTDKTLEELAAFEAEDEAKAEQTRQAEAKVRNDRNMNSKAAVQWLRENAAGWAQNKLVDLLGDQITNDIYDELVRKGELKPRE